MLLRSTPHQGGDLDEDEPGPHPDDPYRQPAAPARTAAMLVEKDQGEPYDKAELARLTRQAVAAIVRRQAEVGVDIINDGEMSKPGYSTYIADRLSGFRRARAGQAAARHARPPEFPRRLERMTGANVARRAVCVGPIACARPRAARPRISPICAAALGQVSAVEGFMTAASPGLVPVFQTNAYYPDRTKPMSKPSPRRCSRNTRRSSMPGSCCSSIAPIWRWRTTPSSRI